jgi:ferredoxin
MPKLIIDNREVEVEQENTILQAARRLGIDIPALCFNDGCQPSTSCMVCAVKVNSIGPGVSAYGRLVPSCATEVQDGMEIEIETDEVREARRTALELLLSDHLGDCMAPCHRTCPAGMNIPLMIRQIGAGDLQGAISTIKKDIALPAVLGRICPAPCEKGCRRGAYDNPVSICLLKRYAADADLTSESPYMPQCKAKNGKRVAVVGAGPAGLSAAYYLLQEGYECVVFDDHENPGGMLRYAVPEDRLPREVLDAEIGIIEKLGAEFRMGTRVGEHLLMESLQRDYDAVLIATGGDVSGLGIEFGIDRSTLQTNVKGVFAGGKATGRSSNMAVRSVADGKAAAVSIDYYSSISGIAVAEPRKPFSVYIGRLFEGEIERFMVGVSRDDRVEPRENAEARGHRDKHPQFCSPPLYAPTFPRFFPDDETGFSGQEAHTESNRCLHCDCRKAYKCKLRDYSERYEANPGRYKGDRQLFEQHVQHLKSGEDVVYEPGKCIKCGLCVQITSRYKEPLGLTFIGRGFNVRVGASFDRAIAEGLQKVAAQVVDACPTGALAFK